jgi:hypothetical protein
MWRAAIWASRKLTAASNIVIRSGPVPHPERRLMDPPTLPQNHIGVIRRALIRRCSLSREWQRIRHK